MDNKNYVSTNYKYVDLGLPSGTLWCDRNLGANNKYEDGGYYQWGGIENIYENANYYKNGNNNVYDLSYKRYNNVPGAKLTRDIVPGGEYDTVTHLLGTKWQMPTELQFKELFDNRYVDIQWKNKYDKTDASGLLITSNTNGNSIFLPAAGFITEDYIGTLLQEEYINEIKKNPDFSVDFKLKYKVKTGDYNQITGSYWSTYIDTRDYIFASNLAFSEYDTKNNERILGWDINSDLSSDIRWRAYSIRPVYYRTRNNVQKNNSENINYENLSEILYEKFLENKNFTITKINTIYDDISPFDKPVSFNDIKSIKNSINEAILTRLMKNTDNTYTSNISKCSNSLIFYKYKFKNSQKNQTTGESDIYTGINIYYCDNEGLCFLIMQNMYNEENISGETSDSEVTEGT